MGKIPTIRDLRQIAQEAAEIIVSYYFSSQDLGIEWKEGSMPVTKADRDVAALLSRYMHLHFPGLPIEGEEGRIGTRSGDPDEYWLCTDELDGTRSFTLGLPVFTFMITLMRGDLPVACAIADPISRRVYTAEKGAGAFCNGKQIRAYSGRPKQPVVGIAAWPPRKENPMVIDHMFTNGPRGSVAGALADAGYRVVQVGAIGFLDALVAAGKYAATIFPGGLIHDTAAGDLLVQEAGGMTSNVRGLPLSYGLGIVHGHLFSCSDLYEELTGLVAPYVGT